MTLHSVALIDGHQLFLDGLQSVLESQADLKVVASTTVARLAAQLVRASQPAVVVLDLAVPHFPALSVVRELLADEPRRRVLVLSPDRDEECVAAAMKAGAAGYLLKTQPALEVVSAIRETARGGRFAAPPLAARPLRVEPDGRRQDQLEKLTGREREIFDLTVAGRSSRDVAGDLRISPRTVETHRARILRKLGARTAADLVRIAAKSGLIGGAPGLAGLPQPQPGKHLVR